MNYYDKNAQEFFNKTVNANMSPHQEKFLELLPKNACILDAGCGSGRDSREFKLQGYKVCAIDGSAEMCKLASEYAGINVKQIQFQDISFIDEFDGIWASASLLHLTDSELELVLDKLHKALKRDGILYASFKYGDFKGVRNGRYFNDLDEKTASEIFKKHDFKVIETWISSDSRKGREKEKWINILVKS